MACRCAGAFRGRGQEARYLIVQHYPELLMAPDQPFLNRMYGYLEDEDDRPVRIGSPLKDAW